MGGAGNGLRVATRAQVLALVEAGQSYETVGRALGIPPGLAFMIATGLPADGSGEPAPEELAGMPALAASTQHLVNPRQVNPVRKEHVMEWVRERAARELRKPG
jgi:hypothetical protein